MNDERKYECNQCGRLLTEARVLRTLEGHTFCDAACAGVYAAARRLGREVHSSTGRTEVSKTSDPGSSPGGPANIEDVLGPVPDGWLRGWAQDFLIKYLGASADDPDFEKWLGRTIELFKRYRKLTPKCPKPLGSEWGDEYCEAVDATLDKIERKVKAAEDVLG